MSIKRRRALYIPTCDCCGAILAGTGTYWDAVDILIDAGWRHFREDGSGRWIDLCKDCDGEW